MTSAYTSLVLKKSSTGKKIDLEFGYEKKKTFDWKKNCPEKCSVIFKKLFMPSGILILTVNL